MPYTTELVHELNALTRFSLDSGQQGIKVHKTADPAVIAAVQRLHAKGLVTQTDGGYLTSLGHEAAELATPLLGILTEGAAATVG
ncbi:TIGR02647 family protein [Propionivibrio limicola]|uniref:TIGR02647 family protein n=1 Tax=Propionivibrio limicola TaxID=167645 RepID=UPI0012921F4E|nr:TIGR02647 family protein [Propionivibrio limicola]